MNCYVSHRCHCLRGWSTKPNGRPKWAVSHGLGWYFNGEFPITSIQYHHSIYGCWPNTWPTNWPIYHDQFPMLMKSILVERQSKFPLILSPPSHFHNPRRFLSKWWERKINYHNGKHITAFEVYCLILFSWTHGHYLINPFNENNTVA